MKTILETSLNNQFSSVAINLDPYTDGDPEFTKELATSLIGNVNEFQQVLVTTLVEKQIDDYRKACHKVKTAFTILGGENLQSIAEDLKDFILIHDYDSHELKKVITLFDELMQKIIGKLNALIR